MPVITRRFRYFYWNMIRRIFVQVNGRGAAGNSLSRNERNLIEWDFQIERRRTIAQRPMRRGSGRFASAFQSK